MACSSHPRPVLRGLGSRADEGKKITIRESESTESPPTYNELIIGSLMRSFDTSAPILFQNGDRKFLFWPYGLDLRRPPRDPETIYG